MYKEELIKITTDDFEEIALWKVYNKKTVVMLTYF